jgi:hypothetical protein
MMGIEAIKHKLPQDFESLKSSVIDNSEEGLGLFSIIGIQRTTLLKNRPQFQLEWSNDTFDIHFQCKERNI